MMLAAALGVVIAAAVFSNRNRSALDRRGRGR